MTWWELAVVVIIALPLAILLQDWRTTVGWLIFHAVALCFHLGALLLSVGAHLVAAWLALATLASAFRQGLLRGVREARRRPGN